ncbi:predicted protein [Micromonas commoda]|uniref:Uncharacterized protein n=1 Tax=Micromonas commoda (strain RCC299 / NOUM17 / CCMP2709) TaxID=296587 RepID=C1EI42_MICCC|nr:predicted protein [Micromonas commoda]ACO67618.1 predicted protein [Micromonas commoda]|eukprot:XP_002506360.1 predicted protein [Micromonas commoda]
MTTPTTTEADANRREHFPRSWSRPGTLLPRKGGGREEAVEGATLWLEFYDAPEGPLGCAPSVSVACASRRLELVRMEPTPGGGEANVARSPRDRQVIIVRGPSALRARLLADREPGEEVLFRFRLDSSVDADECFHLLRHWLGAPFDSTRKTTSVILDPMPVSARLLNLSLGDDKDEEDKSDVSFEEVKPEEAKETPPALEGDDDSKAHHYDPIGWMFESTAVRRYVRDMILALASDGGEVTEPVINFANTPVGAANDERGKLSFARYIVLADSVIEEMQATGELELLGELEEEEEEEEEEEDTQLEIHDEYY